jgi:hypothetical protein
MTVTIQTSVRHNKCTNDTFIYVRPANGEPQCRYAAGYEYNECPHIQGKVTLYAKLDATCPVIIGYIAHVVTHTLDSVSTLIFPSLQFYSKEFHPGPYHLPIPNTWIELSPLQVVSRRIYLAFHPSHCIDLFEDHHHCIFLISPFALLIAVARTHLYPHIFIYHADLYYCITRICTTPTLPLKTV